MNQLPRQMLQPANNNGIGGIIPPDGYTIDANGKLQENKFELIEKIIFGYSITTEQPTEGWYNGETLVEQDLYDTTFTPIVGTFYKHTGVNSSLRFKQNAIFYWNGTKYIAYYKTNYYAINSPYFGYNPLTQAETWEAGKYYQYNGGWNILVSEPSDWSTNWKSYFYHSNIASNAWSYLKITSNTAPTFIPNTYWWYDTANSSTAFTRTVEPNGTQYNFTSMMWRIGLITDWHGSFRPNYGENRVSSYGVATFEMIPGETSTFFKLHNGQYNTLGIGDSYEPCYSTFFHINNNGIVQPVFYNGDRYSTKVNHVNTVRYISQHITRVKMSDCFRNDEVVGLYFVRP